MKVACIQMDVKNCDNTTGEADIIGMNLQRAMDHIHDAVDKGAELIVLPEVFSTGFCYDSMDKYAETAETAPWPTVTALCEEFGDDDVCIIGSFIERTDGGVGDDNDCDVKHSEDGMDGSYLNTGFCIDKGEVAGVYRKCHPFGREKEIFTKGSDISPIPTSKGVIGLEICYELRFPEVARTLALKGADILVTIAQFPHPRSHHWDVLVPARAIENQMPHVACNCVGTDANGSYFGHSAIVDAYGNVVAEASEEECILLGDVDMGSRDEFREKIPCFADRCGELYL